MELKLALYGLAGIIAIIIGIKVSKNFAKLVAILVIALVGYITYNASVNGKTLDTKKIGDMATKVVDGTKSLLRGADKLAQPLLTEKEQ